ncbi:MAG: transglutaminase family protein [Chitinophagaceae bacterium]|nr:MAG: transglutaminase family protein [Chitinophagaceae bacterium]
MKFKITVNLSYRITEPATIILNILPVIHNQFVERETFIVDGIHQTDNPSITNDKTRYTRTLVNEPGMVNYSYSGIVENKFSVVTMVNVIQLQVSDYPFDFLPWLYPSRYCESDKLTKFATHHFGKIENRFEQVTAICEWIHRNTEYVSGSTTSDTSAIHTITQQEGVCRDFAHLGIALCRALDIPARYCSVYACQLVPQDFHAVFEAYIAGYWLMFDATRLAPINGFVRICHGRDAADTAIANTFGGIELESMSVNSELVEGTLIPFFNESGNFEGIAYDIGNAY